MLSLLRTIASLSKQRSGATRRLSWTLLLSLAASIASCATIVGKSTQALKVNAVCEGQLLNGATCELSNEKGRWTVQTPGAVTVHKAYGPLHVQCRVAEQRQSVTLDSMSNTAFSNVIAGGAVGYAVDSSTGAGFDYPEAVTVVFQPPCSTNEGSAP